MGGVSSKKSELLKDGFLPSELIILFLKKFAIQSRNNIIPDNIAQGIVHQNDSGDLCLNCVCEKALSREENGDNLCLPYINKNDFAPHYRFIQIIKSARLIIYWDPLGRVTSETKQIFDALKSKSHFFDYRTLALNIVVQNDNFSCGDWVIKAYAWFMAFDFSGKEDSQIRDSFVEYLRTILAEIRRLPYGKTIRHLTLSHSDEFKEYFTAPHETAEDKKERAERQYAFWHSYSNQEKIDYIKKKGQRKISILFSVEETNLKLNIKPFLDKNNASCMREILLLLDSKTVIRLIKALTPLFTKPLFFINFYLPEGQNDLKLKLAEIIDLSSMQSAVSALSELLRNIGGKEGEEYRYLVLALQIIKEKFVIDAAATAQQLLTSAMDFNQQQLGALVRLIIVHLQDYGSLMLFLEGYFKDSANNLNDKKALYKESLSNFLEEPLQLQCAYALSELFFGSNNFKASEFSEDERMHQLQSQLILLGLSKNAKQDASKIDDTYISYFHLFYKVFLQRHILLPQSDEYKKLKKRYASCGEVLNLKFPEHRDVLLCGLAKQDQQSLLSFLRMETMYGSFFNSAVPSNISTISGSECDAPTSGIMKPI